jgi:hypothetical protein
MILMGRNQSTEGKTCPIAISSSVVRRCDCVGPAAVKNVCSVQEWDHQWEWWDLP